MYTLRVNRPIFQHFTIARACILHAALRQGDYNSCNFVTRNKVN